DPLLRPVEWKRRQEVRMTTDVPIQNPDSFAQRPVGSIGTLVGPPICSAWARASVAERVEWVGRFRRLVARHQAELCSLMEVEIGKTPSEALFADVAPLLAAIGWCERHAGSILKPRRQRGAPWWLGSVRVTKRMEPLGAVAIIATWNYPVQLLGIQLVHALAAGNTVMVKPSESAPRTQVRLLELAAEAGLPRGALTVRPATREAGSAMLAEFRFDHVVFTGSTAVGRAINISLAGSLTPATLELSGRDSALVLEDADPKFAARCIWTAVTVNAGQTCMGPRRAIVHEAVYPAFVAELSKLASRARPRQMISEAAAVRCHELAQAAMKGGARDATGTLAEPLGRLVRPTAIVDCRADQAVVQGDHFGPLLAVLSVANITEMLRVHRSVGQHLVTSVFVKDRSRGRELAAELGSGIVMLNDVMVPTGHPAVGLGGHGASGMGVSRGEEGIRSMARPVWVTESKGGIRKMAMTLSPAMVRAAAWFIRWWYGGGLRERLAASESIPQAKSGPEAGVPLATPAVRSMGGERVGADDGVSGEAGLRTEIKLVQAPGAGAATMQAPDISAETEGSRTS
ncbi:MAG: aldehyde dehydrogenase family protein, partial [bacterium]|nr:aldehyde dehydrogenase family protein [bacterium]